MTQSQALQVLTIENNGYFQEEIGTVRILNHYHSFLFYVNTTKLELAFNQLQSNAKLLEHKSRNDKLTNKIFIQLWQNCIEIETLLKKFDFKTKRALANILGKAIKFVTGNLDEDDLENINNNLNKLYNNQNAELTKINKLTTFANHLSHRYTTDLNIITENLKNTKTFMENFKSIEETRILLQNEVYESERLLNKLQMIERTISLSWKGIPDIELLTVDELESIQNYLLQHYNKQQLLLINNVHLFKILEKSKLSIVGINETITFLLKVPILEPFIAQYYQIYPIPNHQDIAILPPRKFLITINSTEYWTDEDCQSYNNIFLCLNQPIQDNNNCSLSKINNCPSIKITNSFKIVKILRNHQLLVIFKEKQEIIEDCQQHFSRTWIQGTKVLSSTCRMIIETAVYDNTVPIHEIEIYNLTKKTMQSFQHAKLKLKHLQDPKQLEQEAEDLTELPIHLQPLSYIIHYSFTIVSTLCLIVFIVLVLKYRTRILELFCKPRKIIRIRRGSNNTQKEDPAVIEIN